MANSAGRRRKIAARYRIEWPTIGLTALIYGGWLGLIWFHDALPGWVLFPLGTWVIAWHSSLQHEFVHNHPTRWRQVNWALGFPPLSLWLPYERYRRLHLVHHIDARLTDPLDDPESRYWTASAWQGVSPTRRFLARCQATLLGRLTVGPFLMIAAFLRDEARRAVRNGSVRQIWMMHLLGVIVVLGWVHGVCGMSVTAYLLGFVLPGTSLLLVRSFAEHRADSEVDRRTAVVENSWIFGVLFLFNNLHAAHHRRPALPWYTLPNYYRTARETLLEANGALVYQGYGDVFRRFLVQPHDRIVHPLGRVSPRALTGSARLQIGRLGADQPEDVGTIDLGGQPSEVETLGASILDGLHITAQEAGGAPATGNSSPA